MNISKINETTTKNDVDSFTRAMNNFDVQDMKKIVEGQESEQSKQRLAQVKDVLKNSKTLKE